MAIKRAVIEVMENDKKYISIRKLAAEIFKEDNPDCSTHFDGNDAFQHLYKTILANFHSIREYMKIDLARYKSGRDIQVPVEEKAFWKLACKYPDVVTNNWPSEKKCNNFNEYAEKHILECFRIISDMKQRLGQQTDAESLRLIEKHINQLSAMQSISVAAEAKYNEQKKIIKGNIKDVIKWLDELPKEQRAGYAYLYQFYMDEVFEKLKSKREQDVSEPKIISISSLNIF